MNSWPSPPNPYIVTGVETRKALEFAVRKERSNPGQRDRSLDGVLIMDPGLCASSWLDPLSASSLVSLKRPVAIGTGRVLLDVLVNLLVYGSFKVNSNNAS